MSPEPREISDAQTMRALAHPVRLALLDVIRAEGEMTASRAAELLGDSPGNMSWHLQTLAKYGFVEDAGTGKGRSRPWRLVNKTVRFDSTASTDPEDRAAGDALEIAVINSGFDQLQDWRRHRAAYPEWARQSFINSSIAYLTPAELSQLSDELQALFNRYDDRTADTRPGDSQPVRLMGFGHPLTAEGGG